MDNEWDELPDSPPIEEGLLEDGVTSLYGHPDPEDTVELTDISYRISVRLNPSNALHLPIIQWISQFPRDKRGLRDIGSHVIRALYLYMDSLEKASIVAAGRTGPERFLSSGAVSPAQKDVASIPVRPPFANQKSPVRSPSVHRGTSSGDPFFSGRDSASVQSKPMDGSPAIQNSPSSVFSSSDRQSSAIHSTQESVVHPSSSGDGKEGESSGMNSSSSGKDSTNVGRDSKPKIGFFSRDDFSDTGNLYE